MSTSGSIREIADKLRADLPIDGSPVQWLGRHQEQVRSLIRLWNVGRTALLLQVTPASLTNWEEASASGRPLQDNEIERMVPKSQREPTPEPLQAGAAPEAPVATYTDSLQVILADRRSYSGRARGHKWLAAHQQELVSMIRAEGTVRTAAALGLSPNPLSAWRMRHGFGDGRSRKEAPRETPPPPPANAITTEAYLNAGMEAVQEVKRARFQLGHGPMHSAHEGYAVILEELDELWEEVKKKPRSPENLAAMRSEVVQVAAMAIAFVVEVCDADPPPSPLR